MLVAFYLDSHDPVLVQCAHTLVESAKRFGYEVLHLTDREGPVLGYPERRLDIKGNFGFKRSHMYSLVEGNAILLDVDTMILEDVSSVFENDFDVAVTTDMRPGEDSIEYNGGVAFSKNPRFWAKIAEAAKTMPFDDWFPLERVYTETINKSRDNILVLRGEEYNYVPLSHDDVQGKIIHYRGARKDWMPKKVTGFDSRLNTPVEVMLSNAVENYRKGESVIHEEAHNGTAIIVGGGPSLKDELMNLRFVDGTIFCLNGTHDFLIENGIVPDYHVLLDARQENVAFVQKPHKDVTYLVAAQCHPDVFKALEGYKVKIWAACFDTPERDCEFASHFKGEKIMLIGGGATVGLKTINLAYIMGYRDYHFFGFDSCYKDDKNHAYRQSLNDGEERISVTVKGRRFDCAPWMAKQAFEFQQQLKLLTDSSVSIHGDGLISWMNRS